MAKVIVIAGESATGKSTSYCSVNLPEAGIHIEGLNPAETFLIYSIDKEVPVENGDSLFPLFTIDPATGVPVKGGRRIISHNYTEIYGIIDFISNIERIKNIVVDDAQYLLSLDFLERKNEEGFSKYAKMGFSFIDLVVRLRNLPQDKIVFILMHTDEYQNGEELFMKLKTIGKMIDEKFTLEGFFSVILSSRKKFNKLKKKVEYRFNTVPQFEKDITKSPIGLFMTDKGQILEEVPNDLGIVRSKILKYWPNTTK